jgi:hypothetical protein
VHYCRCEGEGSGLAGVGGGGVGGDKAKGTCNLSFLIGNLFSCTVKNAKYRSLVMQRLTFQLHTGRKKLHSVSVRFAPAGHMIDFEQYSGIFKESRDKPCPVAHLPQLWQQSRGGHRNRSSFRKTRKTLKRQSVGAFALFANLYCSRFVKKNILYMN